MAKYLRESPKRNAGKHKDKRKDAEDDEFERVEREIKMRVEQPHLYKEKK